MREAENGKHRASCDWGVRCFMQTALRRKTETGNEKDPSAALGMTKRGSTSHIRFQSTAEANLRPFGAPPSKGRRESARNRAAISCTAPFYFAWPAAGIDTVPRIHLFLLRHRQNTATDVAKKAAPRLLFYLTYISYTILQKKIERTRRMIGFTLRAPPFSK